MEQSFSKMQFIFLSQWVMHPGSDGLGVNILTEKKNYFLGKNAIWNNGFEVLKLGRKIPQSLQFSTEATTT